LKIDGVMNRSALCELLEKIRDVSIGIIGDFCLDAYLFLDPAASELSLETGLPTRVVKRQHYSLGGAGNVANNVCALDVGHVVVFGVIGDDLYGYEMTRMFKNLHIDIAGLLIQAEQWNTHVYVKPYQDDQEQNRIDFGNFNVLSQDTCTALLQRLEQALPQLDVVIINQQVISGLYTKGIQNRLQELIRHHPDIPFITDSRHYCNEAEGTTRKINDREGAALCGLERLPDDPITHHEAKRIAQELYERWRQPVFLTRREHGCIVYDHTGFREVPGLRITAPTDTVGAGDSMLAGIAAVLATRADAFTAAEFGNLVAGVTVQKLFQTGTASPEEILAIGTNSDYRENPAPL
jgi:rfaE bifunctional protein kinase chain/domain